MGKRVVIVDRSVFPRMMLKDSLKKAGHEVVGECDSIAETMRLIAQESPDIVITEIMLKETSDDIKRDGIAMTKDILKQYPGVTVLICTTMTQEVMELEARFAGAKGYIRKPYKPETVMRAVQDALNA